MTLNLMKSVSAATSECSLHKPCDPSPNGFECTLVRIGYNLASQVVYYQITLNHDNSVPLAKDGIGYQFDKLYGTDRQDVQISAGALVTSNSARIGAVKISSIYIRTKEDPSSMLLLMYSVQK